MAKRKKLLTPKQELAQLDKDLEVLEADKAQGLNVEIVDQIIKAINDRIKKIKEKGA